MKKTIHKNKVFEIVQTSKKDFELYYKGQLLSTTDVEYSGKTFSELKGTPEDFLDFDASLLPPGFDYKFIHEPDGFFGWYGLTTVSVEKKKVRIDYFFSPDGNERLLRADINLFKLLVSAMAQAKKAGYVVDLNERYVIENQDATIQVQISPKGNLYQHYKKHLDIFEGYFQKACKDIVQNVLNTQAAGPLKELPKAQKKKKATKA